MSKITGIIPPQSYELIRNRIVEILGIELENQFIMTYDPDLDCRIWMERSIPFDIQELNTPAINVAFIEGSWDNEDPRDADGQYSFAVECYVKGYATDSETGDTRAAIIVQKVLGKVRAILNASQYKTLDFPTGVSAIIKNRKSAQIQVWDPKKQQGQNDDTSTSYDQAGRIVFNVKALERVEVTYPPIEQGSDTFVRIGLTNKGYVWIRNGEPIPPPPGPPFSVPLLNSDEKIIYTVTQLTDNPFPLADQPIVDGQGNTINVPYDPGTPYVTPICPVVCAPADIKVNGDDLADVPAGGQLDIVVRYDTAGVVPTVISGGQVVVPDPVGGDATAVLKNTAGGIISTTNIPAGDSEDITAPNGTVTVKNSAGTTVDSGQVLSNGSANFNAPNAVAVLKNVPGTVLSTSNIPSGVSQDITAPNSTVNLINSDADPLSITPVPAGETVPITAPDADVNIRNSNNNIVASGSAPSGATTDLTAPDGVAVLKDTAGNTLLTENIPSGASENVTAPDGAVTVNGNAFGNVKSNGTLNVPVEYVNGTPVGTINAGVVEIPNPIDILNSIFTFESGADLETEITIDSDTDGTYNTATFSGGMASAAYEINGSPAMLPLVVVIGNTLKIIPNAAGKIKLTGVH